MEGVSVPAVLSVEAVSVPAGVVAAAVAGAASFREESPRIWKESTAALTESSAAFVLTEAVIL